MWYIIPLVLLVIGLLFYFVRRVTDNDGWEAGIVVTGILFIIALIVCPVGYYASKIEALQKEQFYVSFVIPSKITEDATTITINSLVAGVWQAGKDNAVSYNSYLVSNRYWVKVPIINTVVYPAPDYLKFIVVK